MIKSDEVDAPWERQGISSVYPQHPLSLNYIAQSWEEDFFRASERGKRDKMRRKKTSKWIIVA